MHLELYCDTAWLPCTVYTDSDQCIPVFPGSCIALCNSDQSVMHKVALIHSRMCHVIYCSVLCETLRWHCIILMGHDEYSCAELFKNMLCSLALLCPVSLSTHCRVLCCVALFTHFAVPCRAVPCRAVLCCARLCSGWQWQAGEIKGLQWRKAGWEGASIHSAGPDRHRGLGLSL